MKRIIPLLYLLGCSNLKSGTLDTETTEKNPWKWDPTPIGGQGEPWPTISVPLNNQGGASGQGNTENAGDAGQSNTDYCNRTDWTVTAYNQKKTDPNLATDNNLETFWTWDINSAGVEWFRLDMKSLQHISKITTIQGKEFKIKEYDAQPVSDLSAGHYTNQSLIFDIPVWAHRIELSPIENGEWSFSELTIECAP